MSSKKIVEMMNDVIHQEEVSIEQVKTHIAELRIIGDTQREQDHRKYLSGSQRIISTLSLMVKRIEGDIK